MCTSCSMSFNSSTNTKPKSTTLAVLKVPSSTSKPPVEEEGVEEVAVCGGVSEGSGGCGYRDSGEEGEGLRVGGGEMDVWRRGSGRDSINRREKLGWKQK